jgi:hypothetical protein
MLDDAIAQMSGQKTPPSRVRGPDLRLNMSGRLFGKIMINGAQAEQARSRRCKSTAVKE